MKHVVAVTASVIGQQSSKTTSLRVHEVWKAARNHSIINQIDLLAVPIRTSIKSCISSIASFLSRSYFRIISGAVGYELSQIRRDLAKMISRFVSTRGMLIIFTLPDCTSEVGPPRANHQEPLRDIFAKSEMILSVSMVFCSNWKLFSSYYSRWFAMVFDERHFRLYIATPGKESVEDQNCTFPAVFSSSE